MIAPMVTVFRHATAAAGAATDVAGAAADGATTASGATAADGAPADAAAAVADDAAAADIMLVYHAKIGSMRRYFFFNFSPSFGLLCIEMGVKRAMCDW